MTTVKAFNEMYGQFLDELTQTFPEEEAVKAEKVSKETFTNFMSELGPWANQLMAKDSGFFVESNPFVKRLNLHVIWAREDATENTKAAIWQYLQTMYILGNTMSMFPPETLSMIESAAEACAKNMQAQGGGLNEQDLMAGMNNMLVQMMGGGAGAGGLQALLGGGKPAQPRPKPNAKSSKRKK
jgi:hypothetical protein